MLIKPIKDLRNTAEISEACHDAKEPIFITKNGYGDMVIMSMETYNEMVKTMAEDKKIAESNFEYAQSGELYGLEKSLAALKEQHFGKV